MHIAITVLREMRDDRLRRTIPAQACVFIVEHVASVPHQVGTSMTFKDVDAVFTLAKSHLMTRRVETPHAHQAEAGAPRRR